LRALADQPGLLGTLRAHSLAGIDDLTWDAAADALLAAYREGTRRIRTENLRGPRALVA
jgi:hypothetical protein